MKIRFGKNQIVDTNLIGEQTVATMMASTEEADILNDSINDGASSYEDQTQLNLMKRLAKGFLAYLKGGSWTDGYLKNALVAEFSDLANDSGIVPWSELEDAMVYDDKADEAGE